MRILTRPLLSLLFSGLATAGLADVTAQQVWGDWRNIMERFGYQVSVSERPNASGLALQDLSIAVDIDTNGSRAEMMIGNVDFIENQDGTVNVMFVEQVPAQVRLTPPEGESVAFTMNYRQSGLQMRVSGTPDQMHYDFSAQSMRAELRDFVLDGTAIPSTMMRIVFGLDDLDGTSETAMDQTGQVSKTFNAKRMHYDIAFADPQSTETATITGSAQDVRFDATSRVPDAASAPADAAALLRAGFGLDGAFSYGPSQMQIAANSPDGPFSGTASSSGGGLQIALSRAGLQYRTRQQDLNVNMTSAASPLPIAFQVAKSAFHLALPLEKRDSASDFSLGFELGGFTMSEMIWGLFDPAGQLSRDPATIALDLTGKLRIVLDLLDPANIAAAGQAQNVPAQLEALTINDLRLTLAGAALNGSGAFTFDTPPGLATLPKPTGNLSLRLVGANQLIDTLVGMGLLPQEQAMGARMMMGLLAVPGDGPDTLVSQIEINAQGHVIANGQRIQ